MRSTSTADRLDQRIDVVVLDLVAQAFPELDRDRACLAIPRPRSPAGTPRRARAPHRTWGWCRRRSPRGTGPRRPRRPRRRSPGRAATAEATCAGSPWDSPAPCHGRGPRRDLAVQDEPATQRRERPLRDRRPTTPPAPKMTTPLVVGPSSSNSATPSAVMPKGSPIAGRVSTVPAALNPNVKLAPIAACTAVEPPTSTSRTKSSAGDPRELRRERAARPARRYPSPRSRTPCARRW